MVALIAIFSVAIVVMLLGMITCEDARSRRSYAHVLCTLIIAATVLVIKYNM